MTSTILAVPLILTSLAAPAGDLAIGDPAPPLDIAHWMKGDAVTEFAPDRVYVLEFWATWCGPCIRNMEHLSETQERYRDRGVTVIGLSDEPLQKTVQFLFRPSGDDGSLQNDRTRYALATDPDRSVHRDYFEAAALRGIPAVFIIGPDARIEWIGHPTRMDPVLEAVVAGTWDRSAHAAEHAAQSAKKRIIRDATRRYTEAMEREQWEQAVAALDDLIAAGEKHSIPTRYGVIMSRLGDYERGRAYARRIAEESWDTEPHLLYQLGWFTWGADKYPIPDEHRDLDFALRVVRRAIELDPVYYYDTMLASIHATRGEHDEAAAAQQRAIDEFASKRPKILPSEMERFETELAEMRETLEAYRRGGDRDCPG